MHASKRKKLEAAGYKVGDTADFLGLSPAESTLVEMKVSLALHMKELRKVKRVSQEKLAAMLGSSQSRVAKMEACDSSVSMDMMVKSMAILGASSGDIAKAMKPAVAARRKAKPKAVPRKKSAAKKKSPAKKAAAKRKTKAPRPMAAA